MASNGHGSNGFVRILVVDDHEDFRKFITSTLRKQPHFQVIGEAQDGAEAVQSVQTLQPDLLLLDIGLPTMNGIEAGRRIRKAAPNTKIVFLTQESSRDMVDAAFDLGASGYIVKGQAGEELITAVQSVMQGKQFISSGLRSLR